MNVEDQCRVMSRLLWGKLSRMGNGGFLIVNVLRMLNVLNVMNDENSEKTLMGDFEQRTI